MSKGTILTIMARKRGRPRKNPVPSTDDTPSKIIKTENGKEAPNFKLLSCVYPCDYCNRMFQTKNGAKIHMGTCASKDRIGKIPVGFDSEDEDDEEFNNNVGKDVDDVFVEEVQQLNNVTLTAEESLHISNEFTNTIEISEFESTENEDQPLILNEFVYMPDSTETDNQFISTENHVVDEAPQYAELKPVSLQTLQRYNELNESLELARQEQEEQSVESSDAPVEDPKESNTENQDPQQPKECSMRSYSSILELMRKQEANKPQDIYDFVDEDDPNDEARAAREKLERTCEICGNEFGDPIELLRHRRDKHKPQKINMSILEVERYFDWPNKELCPICNRAIKTRGYKSVFIKHLLVHTEGITFECSICCRKFKRKDHMKAHKRRHVI